MTDEAVASYVGIEVNAFDEADKADKAGEAEAADANDSAKTNEANEAIVADEIKANVISKIIAADDTAVIDKVIAVDATKDAKAAVEANNADEVETDRVDETDATNKVIDATTNCGVAEVIELDELVVAEGHDSAKSHD